MALFDAAETAIFDITARVEALEAPTDLSVILNEIEALKAEVAELDARLDAVSGAAADPTP